MRSRATLWAWVLVLGYLARSSWNKGSNSHTHSCFLHQPKGLSAQGGKAT